MANNKVIATFEKGAKADQLMLSGGVILIFSSFLTLYDTNIWSSNKSLWLPIFGLGCVLIFINIIMRFTRKKLVVELISNDGEFITIHPVKNLQFSGWIKKPLIRLQKQSIKSVKVYNFYSTGSHTGMYWVCFTFNSNNIIELNIDNYSIVKDIIKFIKTHLCHVDLILDERIKSSK